VAFKKPTALFAGPIQGTILNARGMCTMYWTDYNVPKILSRGANLSKRRSPTWKRRTSICQAIGRIPVMWVPRTSVWAVVLRQLGADFEPEFNRALALLQSVIDYLRPGYGFAFYEIGRLYRVWKRFDDAKASF